MRVSAPPLWARVVVGSMLVTTLGYLISDRINWSQGFGWDGLLYGTLAQHFPAGISGTGTVLLPGISNPNESGPHGLDSYYALRSLPSALAYLLMVGSRRSVTDTIRAFSALNVLCLATVAGSWCGIARRAALTPLARWVGLGALLASFNTRALLYYPVVTDGVGFCLGALAVYAWVAGNELGIFVATVAAGFAWPSELLLGIVLLVWPFEQYNDDAPETSRGSLGLALATGLVTLLAIAYVHHLGWKGLGVWRPTSAALFAGAIACSAFAFAVLAPLLPGDRSWFVPQRPGLPQRLVLTTMIPVIVLVGQSLIARRSGQNDIDLFGNGLLDAARLPGLFLVAAIANYGPIFLIGVALWPRVARTARGYGPGMVIGLALAALFLLFGESRKDLSFFPIEVFAIVASLDRGRVLSRSNVLLFMVLTLIASRLWLPIGRLGDQIDPVGLSTGGLLRLSLSTGVFTSPRSFVWELLIELGVVIVAVLASRWRAMAAMGAGPSRRVD